MVVGGYVGTLGYWRTPPHRLFDVIKKRLNFNQLKFQGKKRLPNWEAAFFMVGLLRHAGVISLDCACNQKNSRENQRPHRFLTSFLARWTVFLLQ